MDIDEILYGCYATRNCSKQTVSKYLHLVNQSWRNMNFARWYNDDASSHAIEHDFLRMRVTNLICPNPTRPNSTQSISFRTDVRPYEYD
jgi:hypothetical protein